MNADEARAALGRLRADLLGSKEAPARDNPHLGRLARAKGCPFRGEACRTCQGEMADCRRHLVLVSLGECLRCVAGDPPRQNGM